MFLPKTKSIIWQTWHKTAADIIHTPCFSLKVLKLPKDAKTIRRLSIHNSFSDVSNYHLDEALDILKKERNMHVKCSWDSKVNYRRNKTINKFKRAACLDDYRDVYSTGRDMLYIYNLKMGMLFAPSYQLTILNLFSLKHIKHLKMTNEDGNRIIEQQIKDVTRCTEEEEKIRQTMPFDLNGGECMEKFRSLLAP